MPGFTAVGMQAVGVGVLTQGAQSQTPPDTSPVDTPPPGGTTSAPTPTSADIHAFTIMRVTTLYLSAPLGPAAINLTVSLT
jgi:hypothetical protein